MSKAEERHPLAQWLNGVVDSDEWDSEMVKDFSPGGRSAAWAERVKREVAEGNAKPFDEGLAGVKAKRQQSKHRT